jgi:hypothetical protein
MKIIIYKRIFNIKNINILKKKKKIKNIIKKKNEIYYILGLLNK